MNTWNKIYLNIWFYKFLGKENGQEICEDLMFPFSRSHLRNVAIKKSNILFEPKNDVGHAKDIREITLDANVRVFYFHIHIHTYIHP